MELCSCPHHPSPQMIASLLGIDIHISGKIELLSTGGKVYVVVNKVLLARI